MYKHSLHALLLLLMTATLGMSMGCKSKPDETVVEKPAPKMALQGIDQYAAYLPADLLVLSVLDGTQALSLATIAMPPERAHNKEKRAEHAAALERDLRKSALKGLGVDFFGAERIILGVADDHVTVILLGDVPIKTKDEQKTFGAFTVSALSVSEATAPPEAVWTMPLPDKKGAVLFFTAATAEKISKGGSLASQPERLARFKSMYKTAPELGLSGAIMLDDENLKKEMQGGPFPPPDAIFFSAQDDFYVQFEGSPESLNGIKTSYESAIAAAGAELASARSEGMGRNNAFEAMAASMGFHSFSAWRDSIIVEGAGEGSTLSFRAPSPYPDRNAVLVLSAMTFGGIGMFGMFMGAAMESPDMMMEQPTEVTLPPTEAVEEEEELIEESK